MEEVTINNTIQPPELRQDWETDSWRAQTNLMCSRIQEKRAVTPQKADPDLPERVQESPAEAWVGGGLLRGLEHLGQQCMHGTF